MRGQFSFGLFGYLFVAVLAGCGSANGGSGFGSGDGGLDASLGSDAISLLGRDGSHGLGGNKEGGTISLGNPDSDSMGSCPTAVTCTTGGQKCGAISNGCGGTLQCGGCTGSDTCGGGGTANVCGSSCTAGTCGSQGIACGTAGNGCGGSLNCGTCPDAGVCSGIPGRCHAASTMCTPTTCTALGFNCGTQSDGCGGSLDCGTCSAPDTCGGGGVASQCGMPTCVPKNCTQLNVSCGQTSNGCNGTISCGTCTEPQACGGGGTFGKCGCTGTCAQEPTCTGTATTTLSGAVYDPANLHPVYNVLVYVPNDTSDPALTTPFAAGVTCDTCGGAVAGGNPLVTTNTAFDGTFTLSNVPVGSGATAIPLVIQTGRWRRQFTVNVTNSCGANSVSSTNTTPIVWQGGPASALPTNGHLTMPTSSSYGDIPRIGILSGSFDMVECELRKMGIADTEFVNPGAWGQGGHIQFYKALQTNSPGAPTGAGATISSATPAQTQLFGTDATTNNLNINQYDLVIAECEGYPQAETTAQQTALSTYLAAGGRVFASDFAYSWLYQNPSLEASASWGGNHVGCGFSVTGDISPTSTNPTATPFTDWLQFVGVASAPADTIAISEAFPNVTSVASTSEEWLYTNSSEYDGFDCGGADIADPIPVHFTFNVPITPAAGQNQCGRVTFSDWHTQPDFQSQGFTFPNECTEQSDQYYSPTTMSDQETILEFMLFDVTACVTPYQATCTSVSCAEQGISCGPAGDGCGNLLQCGTCTTGQTCGGGGSPGVCGTPTCTKTTCAAQNTNCGTIGDGCGGSLSCGTCTGNQTCGGGGTPGQCGTGMCTPESCAQQDINCGPAGNGCGVELQCGTCTGNESCGGGGTPGKCGSSCVPTTCGDLGCNCGPEGDGCGNQLNCGTCTGGETCGGGGVSCQCGTGGPK